MSPALVYGVFGFVLSLPISLALGRGMGRQGALAAAGFALLGVLVVYAYGFGCPEDARECSPLLGLIVGGFVFAGWLVGIGVAFAIRKVRQSRSGRSASQGVR